MFIVILFIIFFGQYKLGAYNHFHDVVCTSRWRAFARKRGDREQGESLNECARLAGLKNTAPQVSWLVSAIFVACFSLMNVSSATNT